MRAWIDKEKWLWFNKMQDEGRTRDITIHTFPRSFYDIEIEIKEIEHFSEEDDVNGKT